MTIRQKDSSAQDGEKTPARENRFRLFGGLRDRLNKSTSRKVIKSLVAAMHDSPERAEARIQEAAGRFSELGRDEQDQVLGDIEGLLERAAPNCGQSELITIQVYNISYFLSLAAKSIESLEGMETIHENLAMAAASHQAEYTSDMFREMRSMAVIAAYECGCRSESIWEELIMHSGSRTTAANCLLEMGESTPGWALLRSKLDIAEDTIVASPSDKKNAFILSTIKGKDEQAARRALKLAAQMPEREAFYKAAEQISLRDAAPEKLWAEARGFMRVSELLSEIEGQGPRQVEAVGELSGLIMGGLGYLRPVMGRHFQGMETLLESGSAKEKLRSIMSMCILSSAGIGRSMTDAQVQGLVNNLLNCWDDESIEALRNDSPRLVMPIALSNSSNRSKMVSLLLSEENPALLRAGFNISLNFLDTSSARERAEEVLAGESADLKACASEFLDTLALVEDLDMADERQFSAAHRLIDRYLSNPTLIGIMLQIRSEMEGMIIEAAQAGGGENVDVTKEFDVVNHLMAVGIMPERLSLNYEVSA